MDILTINMADVKTMYPFNILVTILFLTRAFSLRHCEERSEVQFRWSWWEMRLPRPDKPGLAMTRQWGANSTDTINYLLMISKIAVTFCYHPHLNPLPSRERIL
jgi:hypothetical protein